MRHRCGSSSDRISELPCNIIDTILTFLPLREAARTSILSRNWRFHWTRVPRLIFDDSVNESRSLKTKNRYSMGNIFEILLLHQGPISKFTLNAADWPKSTMIDKVILFLSRNGIQDLTLRMKDRECQRLASSIFSCVELKHLSLRACIFQPLTLVGFKNLVSAELLHVIMDPIVSIPCGASLESLKLIIYSKIDYFSVNGPNLKSLSFEGSIFDACEIFAPLKTLALTGIDKGLIDGNFDIIHLLRFLPLLQNLHLSHKFRQLLGNMLLDENSLAEFATMLHNLTVLELIELDLDVYGQAPSVLWLMESSPSLEKIIIQLNQNTYDEPCETEYNDGDRLKSLREIEVSLNYDCKPMFGSEFFNFLKFLLAITPNLETLYIKLNYEIDVDGYKSLLELASLPRASPEAEILYPGLN